MRRLERPKWPHEPLERRGQVGDAVGVEADESMSASH
jgi:hypothetical protein